MADTSVNSFPTNAFEPLVVEQDIQGISRPSLSYWQDAWLRLKANHRALVSLWIVISLLLFTFLGPVLWTVDPTVQDVEQISQAPGADRSVTLVDEYTVWQVSSDTADAGLQIIGTATTQHVRLIWGDFSPQYGYRVYLSLIHN